jgi:hypothetical protein
MTLPPALAVGLILAALSPAQGPRITILLSGTPDADARRGIELGVVEAMQTARLLGGDVSLTRTARADGAEVSGVIVAGGIAGAPGFDVPRIHLSALPPGSSACDFALAGPGGPAVLWHPTLDRYGASELNERFARRFGAGMSSHAYAGWVAVKALVESALRTTPTGDRCASLARLRFDGHKGRPLSFDPQTRVLRQPVYIVEGGKVVGEKQ